MSVERKILHGSVQARSMIVADRRCPLRKGDSTLLNMETTSAQAPRVVRSLRETSRGHAPRSVEKCSAGEGYVAGATLGEIVYDVHWYDDPLGSCGVPHRDKCQRLCRDIRTHKYSRVFTSVRDSAPTTRAVQEIAGAPLSRGAPAVFSVSTQNSDVGLSGLEAKF